MTEAADPAASTVLVPQWPAPRAVRAAFTLRGGGVSRGPYASLNLGAHVGDDAAAVSENRRRLRARLNLPAEPEWVEQVHGIGVLDLDAPETEDRAERPRVADAVIGRRAGQVCVVQVADCLPVLFASLRGDAIAVAHAGWRGLAAGVLETTIARLRIDPGELLAWLGPAIGAPHFEVGAEVRAAFLAHDAGAASAFFTNERGRWQCDLRTLARQRLQTIGLGAVFGVDSCTFSDPARFFSYRRDGRCGRMAALVWLE
ncbi:MAG: peptidoglycan editing factor PgeF [Gammaproteobacteria bacterium]|nr:peptidoglycan editing factor PgeF [Gammaproteobacteria bacterium]